MRAETEPHNTIEMTRLRRAAKSQSPSRAEQGPQEPPPIDRPPDGPEGEDDIIRAEVGQPTTRRPMVLEWFNQAADAACEELPAPLIEDMLDEGAMSVIYGPSNAGKTFAALDMAYHVAAGLPWNGKRTRRGLVVYVAAEGGTRIRRRIAALRQHFGGNEPLLALVRYQVDLRSSDTNARELVHLARRAAAERGAEVVWLYVDTLSRALAGGDENSSVDMGRIVTVADLIRADLNCHLTYIHHTGKDQARGARGHSLLRAATDTEIEIEPGKMSVTKQRDLEGGFSIGFRLQDMEIHRTADGKPVKSAVVEWTGEAAAKKPTEEKIAKQARLLIDAIHLAIGEAGEWFRPFHDGPEVRGVAEDAVRERYYIRLAERTDPNGDDKKAANARRQAFGRAIKKLLDSKALVACERNGERFLWLP